MVETTHQYRFTQNYKNKKHKQPIKIKWHRNMRNDVTKQRWIVEASKARTSLFTPSAKRKNSH